MDKLEGPAYSTSVGLLRWAQHESLAVGRANGKKRKKGAAAAWTWVRALTCSGMLP